MVYKKEETNVSSFFALNIRDTIRITLAATNFLVRYRASHCFRAFF